MADGRRGLRTTDLVRLLAAWGSSTAALIITGALLPRFSATSWWSFAAVAAVAGAVGLVLRPVMVEVSARVGWLAVLLVALGGQALVMYVAILTVPGLLAACGSGGSKAAVTTTGGKQQMAKTLHFSNWTLYIDVNNKTKAHPSLQEFQQKYGTHVDYVEDINDNFEFFGKVRQQLQAGKPISRDIVVLTDYMAGKGK